MFGSGSIAGSREAKHDDTVAQFTIAVCERLDATTYADIPKYVRLTWGSGKITLKSMKLKGAACTFVRINEGTPGAPTHGTICRVDAGSKRQYLVGRMLRDPRRRTVIAGLLLALASLFIDAAILFGEKDVVVVTISASAHVMWRGGSFFMKAIGLSIAFYGEVLKD